MTYKPSGMGGFFAIIYSICIFKSFVPKVNTEFVIDIVIVRKSGHVVNTFFKGDIMSL